MNSYEETQALIQQTKENLLKLNDYGKVHDIMDLVIPYAGRWWTDTAHEGCLDKYDDGPSLGEFCKLCGEQKDYPDMNIPTKAGTFKRAYDGSAPR